MASKRRPVGFLTVVSADEAKRRWAEACPFAPRGEQEVPLAEALGRVLSRDLAAPEDVPSFRRADRDGFAVRASDTYGATEEAPRSLRREGEALTPGKEAKGELSAGAARPVATGAAVPRGADAVVQIEDTVEEENLVRVTHPVVPGENVTQAGTDLSRGETVGRRGDLLGPRDTAVLAACGVGFVPVYTKPRVSVISTGDELIDAFETMREGLVRDVNGPQISDASRSAGGEVAHVDVIPDNPLDLMQGINVAALKSDLVVMSGGTSKGAGDHVRLILEMMAKVGHGKVLVHGVALRPGKPLILAQVHGKPLAVLPGFPTSAVFTFHEFVAPVIRRMAGLPERAAGETVAARLAVRHRSKKGFLDFTLVDLVRGREGLLAYPIGKGSGSVTTYARADGFFTVPEDREQIEAGEEVAVVPLAADRPLADLSVVGSHCRGVDALLRLLRERTGHAAKIISVGSTAGLEAARRGACDLAGVHLLDEKSGEYNEPFVRGDAAVSLVRGYRRRQGWVFRKGDARFEGKDAAACAAVARSDPAFLLAQRNRGSGTRILLDGLFGDASASLRGGDAELRSHVAVCAAVRHGKADGGLAEETAARAAGLGFAFLREERFDFLVPADRGSKPAVKAFLALLGGEEARAALRAEGFPA